MAIIIGSLWFLVGGTLSIVWFSQFLLEMKRKTLSPSFNGVKVLVFVVAILIAQIPPAVLFITPGRTSFSYLWPFLFSLDMLVLLLVLRTFRVKLSNLEMLLSLFPLAPGIVFLVIRKEWVKLPSTEAGNNPT